jgi:hypothetical protein
MAERKISTNIHAVSSLYDGDIHVEGMLHRVTQNMLRDWLLVRWSLNFLPASSVNFKATTQILWSTYFSDNDLRGFFNISPSTYFKVFLTFLLDLRSTAMVHLTSPLLDILENGCEKRKPERTQVYTTEDGQWKCLVYQ